MLYWGAGAQGWDMEARGSAPRICKHCNDLADSWRGRFENAQVTLRMCAAEGAGFKKYIQHFLMLSAKASFSLHLPSFYRWSVRQKRKVLTERVVLGTLLEAYQGSIANCGVQVGARPGVWKDAVRETANQLLREARRAGGKLAVLILDAGGHELSLANMMKRTGNTKIGRLMILLGGPDGIPADYLQAIYNILAEYADFPPLQCSLPGGLMHSYYALANLFVFHDQGVLLPHLAYLAELSGTRS